MDVSQELERDVKLLSDVKVEWETLQTSDDPQALRRARTRIILLMFDFMESISDLEIELYNKLREL